jgi:Leucine-rich repeat (LRR) protein
LFDFVDFASCDLVYLLDGEVRWIRTDNLAEWRGHFDEIWMPMLFEGDSRITYRRAGRRLVVNGEVKSLDLRGLDGRAAARLIDGHKKTLNLVMFHGDIPRAALETLYRLPTTKLTVYIRAFSGDPADLEALSRVGGKLYGLMLDESVLTQKHFASVAGLKSLRLLSVAGAEIEHSRVSVLKKLKHLRHLSLARTRISSSSLTSLKGLPLIHLDLRRTRLQGAGLAAISSFKALRRLVIGGRGLSTIDGKQLAYLSGLRSLESLSILTWERLTREDARVFGRFEKLREILVWGATFEKGALSVLRKNQRLEAVRLEAGGWGDTSFSFVSQLSNLRVLLIHSSDPDAEAMRNISKASLLEKLDLFWTGVDSAEICELQGLKRLKYLNISGTDVGTVGLKCVARLGALEHLHLSQLSATSEGLSALKNLKNLRVLSADKTKFGNEHAHIVAALGKLEALDVEGTQVDSKGLRQLLASRSLKRLNVTSCPCTLGREEARVSRKSNIEVLLAEDVKMTKGGIGELSKNAKLRMLNLSYTYLEEDQVARLSRMPALRHLICKKCSFGNKAAKEFGASGLNTLVIDGTRLGDEGMRHLSKLPLRRLSLGAFVKHLTAKKRRTHKERAEV